MLFGKIQYYTTYELLHILYLKEGIYKVGTKAGVIESWFHWNVFEKTEFKGLLEKKVFNLKYSVRGLVKLLSIGSGQGYKWSMCEKGKFCY